MSAVTVELPPGAIGFGEALVPSTIQGVKSATPETASQPALPGPALQPHQLFSSLTLATEALLKPAVVLPTMRLKCAVPVPLPIKRTPVPLVNRLLLVMLAVPLATSTPNGNVVIELPLIVTVAAAVRLLSSLTPALGLANWPPPLMVLPVTLTLPTVCGSLPAPMFRLRTRPP